MHAHREYMTGAAVLVKKDGGTSLLYKHALHTDHALRVETVFKGLLDSSCPSRKHREKPRAQRKARCSRKGFPTHTGADVPEGRTALQPAGERRTCGEHTHTGRSHSLQTAKLHPQCLLYLQKLKTVDRPPTCHKAWTMTSLRHY